MLSEGNFINTMSNESNHLESPERKVEKTLEELFVVKVGVETDSGLILRCYENKSVTFLMTPEFDIFLSDKKN